ncbi:hypothetical protein LLS47_23745 [Rouxiella badensis]|uniref:hypothetical protein n=1 Tax=Rouxiella badensis TaxID=1646377 RepID=UPI001D1410A5|nr:hypothetical protein [Rouxiella badensis]MCC3735917.1 hypothetical protein [Rouxiella badensis]MCC3761314.1 hypothetical protein [Rouxiella badensis]
MNNVFKSKRRLSRKNTKIVMVGFSDEQMTKMSMSFKNRSLAMSCLSKWVLEDLIKRGKTLLINLDNGKYDFIEKDFIDAHVFFNKKETTTECINRRSVVIDNETIDLVEKSCQRYSLFKLLPALTLYAIEKLNKESKVFMQDKNNELNIYIKTI